MLAMAVPGTVLDIGYIRGFSNGMFRTGFLKGLYGTSAILIIAFVVRSLPTGTRSGISALRQIDKSIEESAIDLGAGSAKVFFTVTLPSSRIPSSPDRLLPLSDPSPRFPPLSCWLLPNGSLLPYRSTPWQKRRMGNRLRLRVVPDRLRVCHHCPFESVHQALRHQQIHGGLIHYGKRKKGHQAGWDFQNIH